MQWDRPIGLRSCVALPRHNSRDINAQFNTLNIDFYVSGLVFMPSVVVTVLETYSYRRLYRPTSLYIHSNGLLLLSFFNFQSYNRHAVVSFLGLVILYSHRVGILANLKPYIASRRNWKELAQAPVHCN